MKYLYIISGIIIYMCIGSVYSWSIFRKPLEQLLNISSTQSGIPYTLMLLSFSLTMPVGGKILQKFGLLKTILPGVMCVSLGLVLSGIFKNITLISLFYGVLGGIGVGLIYGVPIAVVAKWFVEKKGTFIGITLSGFGLSPFITAPISKYFIDLYGVFDAFKILGLIYLIVIVVFSFILKMPKEIESSSGVSKSNKTDYSVKDMLKTKEFYGLWLCYMIGCFAGLTIIGITSPFAQEVVKIESFKAAIFISIFSIFNAIGRPLFGFLVDKIKSFKTILLLFSINIIASICGLFIKESSVLMFFIVFCLFYLTLGGWLATAPASTSFLFGQANYAYNYGVVFTAYGMGAVLGNLISGSLKDLLNSYSYTFYPILILCMSGIFICLLNLYKTK
ncbi:MAG: OFA family MFS transporter [Endomicrobia bacterium]|nr:OFA family MFS transporter [Endomicrobiia bacterium]